MSAKPSISSPKYSLLLRRSKPNARSSRCSRQQAILTQSLALPFSHRSFWEKSDQGDHLCIVMNPLSTSVQDLRQKSKDQRLPVHVVQRIVRTVADALEGLHGANIMHGGEWLPCLRYIVTQTLCSAIKAENILFSTATQTEFLKPVLDAEPAPTTLKIKKYTVVRSQPLVHSFKWNDKRSTVADWSFYLSNFGHGRARLCYNRTFSD
jgi:hypothetical protein